jgi:hypothetical protein
MNIIELAKRVGYPIQHPEWQKATEEFAALVEAAARANEREACAKLCFSIWNKWLDTPEEDRYKVLYDAEDCAAAIRARGTT